MNKSYSTRSFPVSRLFTMDIGKLGRRKHHIKAIVEFDVTCARSLIKKRRSETGERFSFTSWLLYCIARAVDEHREVHALRKGKRQLVIFDDVDISLMVERRVDGKAVPLPTVIRSCNRKELSRIYEDIETAKTKTIESEQDFVLESSEKRPSVKLFAALPQFLRLLIWRFLLAKPGRVKEMMGTVLVTSIGMMGKLRGWFVPYSIHPLSFAFGSIISKPAALSSLPKAAHLKESLKTKAEREQKGGVVIREFLETTILIDHDVVDGAPAARFIATLKQLLENGYGLG